MYTTDYFINKFEATRDDMWATCLVEEKALGVFAHCAIGMCRKLIISVTQDYTIHETQESIELGKLFKSFLFPSLSEDGQYYVTMVNDNKDSRYQQPTPKQRILAALYDIKKAQEPEVKERIVYVTVDKEVRELQKTELSLQ